SAVEHKQDATHSASEVAPTKRYDASLEEQLFDARAGAKIVTSRVAMRIGDDWRRCLYRQLDSLLDIEEWLTEDAPLRTDSFTTFLRLMFLIKPEVKPGLGVTSTGQLMAMWDSPEGARLTFECMPHDAIRWIVSVPIEDRRDTGVGETVIQCALDVLVPYNPSRWFTRHEPA
ncbi:MAG TPA: hypothetical protein VL100_07380, partial [Croceibacterium sp.]|nr:hypothetical protein [Croceibacterium sp.]